VISGLLASGVRDGAVTRSTTRSTANIAHLAPSSTPSARPAGSLLASLAVVLLPQPRAGSTSPRPPALDQGWTEMFGGERFVTALLGSSTSTPALRSINAGTRADAAARAQV
jgi:hypothetical protein